MKKFFSCDFYRRPRVIILNCPLDFLVTLAIDLWKSLIWSHLYRVSQKFVPLISCTITFDQNFILREISRRCLFLCQVHVFRISVNGMPFLFLSHSVAVAAWSGIQPVDQQMIHFELLYHLVRRIQFNPQTILV